VLRLRKRDASASSVHDGLLVSQDVLRRVEWLAELANEGLLDEEERAEYEALVNAADFIAILKLKAIRNLEPNRNA